MLGPTYVIQSVNLCLFIGELSPLMLKNIKDQLLLISVIFVAFVVWLYCFCGSPLLGYVMFNFLVFHGCTFPVYVVAFLLLSSEGLE